MGVIKMTITATSDNHAKEIFNDLTAKGYEYIMSYLYMQEWKNKTGDIVIVSKGYENNYKPEVWFI